MTAFSLTEVSGRFWWTRKPAAQARKRFRGKKAAIETIQRKRQNVDTVMGRLLAEVAEVQDRWAAIRSDRSVIEAEKLTSVVARAQIMHCALARTVATAKELSIFGLNACDADLESAASLLSRLRVEVRASAARAMTEVRGAQASAFVGFKLTA